MYLTKCFGLIEKNARKEVKKQLRPSSSKKLEPKTRGMQGTKEGVNVQKGAERGIMMEDKERWNAGYEN